MTYPSPSVSSGSASSLSFSSPGLEFSPSSCEPSATSLTPFAVEEPSAEIANVVKLLRQIEVLQDQAFSATGKLMAALIDARIEQNISPSVGKQIRAAISDVAVQISNGQGSLSDLHRYLEAFAKARAIDASMYGDVDKNAPSFSGA